MLPGALKEKERIKEREKNRHRTVNKDTAESDKPIPLSLSPSKRKKQTQPDPFQIRSFEKWYAAYPKHVGRKPALQAWIKLDPGPALVETIMRATARYVDIKRDVEAKYILNPLTWLNQEHWTDEPANGNGAIQPPRKLLTA